MILADGMACACPRCGGVDLYKKGKRKNADGTIKQKYRCRECLWSGSGIEYADGALIDENIKQARKAQKYQDINRVERKAFREAARVANLHEVLNERLEAAIRKHKFRSPKKPKNIVVGGVGVAHFSDLHFNELIDLPINKYDFKIASQRIQKYVHATIREFKHKDAKRVIVCLGGDLLNSDRRTDEITAQATNRTQAQILAVEILQQAIRDYARDWHVDVIWVCGNEGRVNQEIGFNNIVASDNYDHSIPMILRLLFEDYKGVDFHIPENPMEAVFTVNGKTFVLIHGHGGGKGSPTQKASSVRSRYAERGINVDYVIWGHIHEACVSELYSRSGSPAGANAFSDSALGVAGKASLNSYFVTEDGQISGSMIPLQDVNGYFGYDIDESLAAYNAKSLSKTRPKTKVLEIVV